MRLLIDLRWVRSELLDGIARVSLSLTAELLRLHPDWRFGLLFSQASIRDFALNWMQAAAESPITADYMAFVTGFSAQSPLNRLMLWPQVKRFKPDLYFSFYYIFHPLPIPQVSMVHDLIPLLYPDYFQHASLPFKMVMTQKRVLSQILQRSDAIVTVSENTRHDLLQELDLAEKPIYVCPPGVHLPEAQGFSSPKLQALKPGYVLALGRPDPHKNFAGLISAYAHLSNDLRRQHPLVLAGPEHPLYTRQLRNLIQQLQLKPDVQIIGSVRNQDLPELYRQASVFAMLSFYEGFGLPVIEAMSQGVPVMSSNRSSLPEVAGEAALLVNPERSMEIAWGLNRLLKALHVADALRQRGLKRAQLFNWPASAERLSWILQDVLKAMAH